MTWNIQDHRPVATQYVSVPALDHAKDPGGWLLDEIRKVREAHSRLNGTDPVVLRIQVLDGKMWRD